MRLVAITGGIGSGKSVVSKILLALGYNVYDCDSQARRIMDNDIAIKRAIATSICQDAVDDLGNLNRPVLAEIVFNDSEMLSRLNAIVHQAVRDDLMRWSAYNPSTISFVETAILYQSKLDSMVDEVWEVCSPVELRIERVCQRNGISADHVLARIKSQDIVVTDPHHIVKYIYNDEKHSLLIQIHDLLQVYK